MFLRQNVVILLLTLTSGLWVVCGDNKLEDNNNTSNEKTAQECSLPSELKSEIASYSATVQKIIDSAINGSFKGTTYKELARFIDQFGSRVSGSQNLENAIRYMLNKSIDIGLDNVHGEEVEVPHWIRGSETATLVKPRMKNLAILSLGNSIGTPPEGILAEALVIKSFNDLKSKASLAKGKIVVYNQHFESYQKTVAYRSKGAIEAAKVGALASLIRSITPFSLNTPHTGVQFYQENITKIPTACITVEDAHLLQRLQDEGKTIKILLKMEAHSLPNTISRNSIIEIKGTEQPEKIVIISGHIDSWDIGEGAMDDGGGVFVTWGALALLKQLGLKPKRTIRGIFWTAEEFGLIGARQYQEKHANESDNFIFIMEADYGTFNPVGLQYRADSVGECIVKEIVKLLAPINATKTRKSASVGSDISIWTSKGFPGASLDTENDKYFWYHHTGADTLDIENAEALDKNTGLWASVAFVLANLSVDFPREESNVKNNTAN